MSLVLALGSNLGDKSKNLSLAMEALSKYFDLIKKSSVYSSEAVDYLKQPKFYNLVAEYETPEIDPHETLKLILDIEKSLGRTREIDKGPRIIDIDILFYDDVKINSDVLTLPHPRAHERSFVVKPLKELNCFDSLMKWNQFFTKFETEAYPI